MYDLSLWQAHRWQTDTRYYTVEIVQDLFGLWTVRLGWGGLYNRKGRTHSKVVDSYQDARSLLQETARRREKRGYRKVEREGFLDALSLVSLRKIRKPSDIPLTGC